VVLSLAVLPVPASAEEPCATTMDQRVWPEVRRLADAGKAALLAGRFAEALTLYQRAFCVFPAPGLRKGSSSAALNLGRCGPAVEDARYWAEHETEDRRKADASGWLASVETQCRDVVIDSVPPGARLRVDGANDLAGTTPWEAWMRVGPHSLTAAADGFVETVQPLAVVGGAGKMSVSIALMKLPSAPPAISTAQPETPGPAQVPTPEPPPPLLPPEPAPATGPAKVVVKPPDETRPPLPPPEPTPPRKIDVPVAATSPPIARPAPRPLPPAVLAPSRPSYRVPTLVWASLGVAVGAALVAVGTGVEDRQCPSDASSRAALSAAYSCRTRYAIATDAAWAVAGGAAVTGAGDLIASLVHRAPTKPAVGLLLAPNAVALTGRF
jgi:hypothetical protein